MARRTRRPIQGLTLIELIVGMGILSLVFLVLGYIFHQAETAHRIAKGQAEIHQEVRAAFNYLSRELSGIPQEGRLVLASPQGALNTWGVTVHGDVITFTTATPMPVRDSTDRADILTYHNFGAVCYYRFQQMLYRVMDRMDTGETIGDLGVGCVVPPLTDPDTQDQLALRVVTPYAGGSATYGAFEVDYYDTATGTFLPVDGSDTYDSASRGLPRAIRVRLRCWDRGMHIRDEVTGERGIEFQEVLRISAAD